MLIDWRIPGLRRPAVVGVWLALSLGWAVPLHGQDLDTADVRVTLDSALRLAKKAALDAFPDLSDYLLYSVTPRALKGDARGLHWQVRWQERAFPHHRWLLVRVYMSDGHTTAERESVTGS
jgi:hypothetical protein